MRVCSNCMKEKCICNHERYVDIDDAIADIILEFNRKNYYTEACCSGHPENNDYGLYIMFGTKVAPPREEFLKYPLLDFKYTTGCVYVKYPNGRKTPNEIKEKLMMEAMENLREMAYSLPEKEMPEYKKRSLNMTKEQATPSFMRK